MPPVVEFEVFRDYLGVAADAVEVDDVSRLFDAINASIRRLTKRAYEGDEGGSYDQVIRIRDLAEFTLPHAPVEAIASIAPAYFDGTVGTAYTATDWRLEDAVRGVVRLRFTTEYVRVVWTTTGAMSATIPQACLEWGKNCWESREVRADLAGYKTGDDEESYFASLAGHPPRAVLVALYGERHATGGGPV